MRNPLIKRVPKELIGDWQKYLVIVVFMVLMIGFVSGMAVGRDSMLEAIYDGRTTLKLENGSFEFKNKASEDLIEAIEEELEKSVRESIEKAVRTQCEAYGITDEDMIQSQIDAAMKENYDKALREARDS